MNLAAIFYAALAVIVIGLMIGSFFAFASVLDWLDEEWLREILDDEYDGRFP